MKDTFKFFIPNISLSKGEASEDGSVQEMILEGLAGDGSKDTANESLTYNGFDLDRMFYINWEHSKDPDDLIGVILKKELQKGGKLFIKGKLFNGHKKAESAYKLQEFLEKEGRNLGFSVEGKVISRDPINPNVVTKAELYGVALCKVPVNPMTFARISKAFTGEDEIDEEDEEDELEKMDTGSMAPAMPESVEKKKKKSVEIKEVLKKSQIYSKIFNNLTTDSKLADSFFNNLIKPIAKMNGTEITEDVLQKAYAILDLAKGKSASENIEEDKKDDEDDDFSNLKKAMQSSRKDYLEKAKAYSEMCKAKGVDPEKDEEDEEDDNLEKSIRPELFNDDHIAGAPVDVNLIKSAVAEAIGSQLGLLEEIKKSVELRTSAIGAVLKADKEQIDQLSEGLEKANETIALVHNFNEDLRERLQVVERTPIRKAVTTENFTERFPEAKKSETSGADQYNINNKADRDNLEKSINAKYGHDLNNEKNYKMMEAVGTLQMTDTVLPEQAMLLKSEGYELVRI